MAKNIASALSKITPFGQAEIDGVLRALIPIETAHGCRAGAALVIGFLVETKEWPEATIKLFVGKVEEICADDHNAGVQLSYLDVVTKFVLGGAIKGDELRRVVARVAEMARGRSIAIGLQCVQFAKVAGAEAAPLVSVLKSHEWWRVRATLLLALPDLMDAVGPEERAALIFAGAGLDDSKTEEGVATAAAEVAWLVEASPRIGEVVQVLASSESEFTRAALCNALARFHSDAIVKEVAEKLLKDPKSSVKICAITALSRFVLSEVEGEWRERAAIADALPKLGAGVRASVALKLLEDDAWEVRRIAVERLAACEEDAEFDARVLGWASASLDPDKPVCQQQTAVMVATSPRFRGAPASAAIRKTVADQSWVNYGVKQTLARLDPSAGVVLPDDSE